MIILKSPEQVDKIRKAGKILREAGNKAARASYPGISTYELDQIIEQHILENDATPTFKDYGSCDGRPGFPATACISPRDVLVHGIPSKDDTLNDGDIVSIDIGVTKDGAVADSCFTFGIGNVSKDHLKLMEAARKATLYGISLIKPGIRIHEIARAVNDFVQESGYTVAPRLYGHGTGTNLHEPPSIGFSARDIKDLPNIKIVENMVITIEPVICMSSSQGKYSEDLDYWTLRSIDGSWSAQFEHDILVTNSGNEILTPDFLDQLIFP